MLGRVLALRWGLQRALVVQSALLKARMQGSTVTFDLHPTVRFESGTRFVVEPGTTNHIQMSEHCHLQEDVTFHLRGGTFRMGPRASIRKGSVIHLGGDLELVSDNIISYYNVIHCSERIRLDQYASTNEFVTIVDSRHFHGGEHEFFYENVESAPIDIGRNVWMANKCSVLMGVTIGDEAIVAGHAVVHKDVPAKAVVAGVPARVIKQR